MTRPNHKPGKPLPFRRTRERFARPGRRKYAAKTGTTLEAFVQWWCAQGVERVNLAQNRREFE